MSHEELTAIVDESVPVGDSDNPAVCSHYWILTDRKRADGTLIRGKYSLGTCKNCLEQKYFSNNGDKLPTDPGALVDQEQVEASRSDFARSFEESNKRQKRKYKKESEINIGGNARRLEAAALRAEVNKLNRRSL